MGVWGSSYSGGHVLVVAAQDRRVRASSSQVPLISGYANARGLVRADHLRRLRAAFDADRDGPLPGRAAGDDPGVAEDPREPCALPTPDSHDFFPGPIRTRAPAWRNEVTLRSVEMFTRVRAGRLHAADQPDPADDGRRRR